MSVEIAWKQNILVTDFHLLKSLLVVLGFGSQAFVCGFSRQNINSVLLLRLVYLFLERTLLLLSQFEMRRDSLVFSIGTKTKKSADLWHLVVDFYSWANTMKFL